MAVNREFALYPRTRTSIEVLGTGLIDGYSSEEHRVGLRKTRYPVESGLTLTDNAVVNPERLRLEGLVSDLLPAPGNELVADRGTNLWNAIVALERDRTPFDVVTPIRVYRNMLIVRAEVPRNNRTGESLRFILDLEELLLGQTEVAMIPPGQATGPAQDRTTTVDGGDRTAPAETPTGDAVQQTKDTLSAAGGGG